MADLQRKMASNKKMQENTPTLKFNFTKEKRWPVSIFELFGPQHLSHWALLYREVLVFWCLLCLRCQRSWDEMGQKCQYLAQNDQKCIFWTKFARFAAKNLNSYRGKQKFWYPHWSGKGPNGPKMPIFGQKSQFWANLAIHGPKILIFMWVSKIFGIHITEKPPRPVSYTHLTLPTILLV